MSQPTFTKDCLDAFNGMNTQESPNDFFVCGFEGNSHVMALIETGKGGMQRVKEVLREKFEGGIAVAMFRVTAVDDRENTVSYRTKLIHVIFIGPATPVIKRAKIASFNAAFKQPFSSNLSLQTDDIDGDLDETSIEKSLRASGGAHQPTRFDFTNLSAPGEGESKVNRRQQSISPRATVPEPPLKTASTSSTPPPPSTSASPAPVYPTFLELIEERNAAFDARDVEGLAKTYADNAQLHHVDPATYRIVSYNGKEEIKGFYLYLFTEVSDYPVEVKNSEIVDNVLKFEWECQPAGFAWGADTLYFQNGKIVLQTVVTMSASSENTTAPAPVEPVQEEEEEEQVHAVEEEEHLQQVAEVDDQEDDAAGQAVEDATAEALEEIPDDEAEQALQETEGQEYAEEHGDAEEQQEEYQEDAQAEGEAPSQEDYDQTEGDFEQVEHAEHDEEQQEQ